MKHYLFGFILILNFAIRGAFAQGGHTLNLADSLFNNHNWKAAKEKYITYLGDTSKNSRAWNRLGYCSHQLGLYNDALNEYNKALANNPAPQVRNSSLARIARVYSLLNKVDEATDWLIKATATGYNSLPDLDTAADYKNLRQSAKFKQIRQQVYGVVYPCSTEPHGHDFDFWLGQWDVYQTGTQNLVGHSLVESMAGGCALLENWASTQANTGKSFNYYDQQAGKWEQDWVGAGGAADRQRYYNGEYKNGIMHFTFESTDATGKKLTGNFMFYNIDKNTVRQYEETSADGGKTYTVVYDFTYIRKKTMASF